MQKPAVVLLPGALFYDSWAAAMRAQKKSIAAFAKANELNYLTVKLFATGASNGEKAETVRAAMVAEVGEELVQMLYQKGLRDLGAVA